MNVTSITKIALKRHGEWFVYWFIFCVALMLRLWSLGERPLHHDESLYAYYSFRIFTEGSYQYSPMLHGPFLYYLTALAMKLFGDVEVVLYLFPILLGSLLVFLPYLLRQHIGHTGALFAAVILCVSPTLLYYSRFLRHDIFSEFLHALMLIAALQYLKSRRLYWLAIVYAALACSFANHELAYISIFLIALFFWAEFGFSLRLHKLWQWVQIRKRVWIVAIATFLCVYSLLFTGFFTHGQGFLDGLPNPFSKRTSLGYWLSQHEVHRGGQPLYYYLTLLLAYEFLVLGLFLYGCRAWKGLIENPVRKFLLFWALGSLLIYSLAGERMPWLLMHQLLPMLLLAGHAFGLLFDNRKYIGIGLCSLLLLATCFVSFRLNFFRGADPKELMVYVQTSPDVLKVNEVLSQFRDTHQRPPRLLLDHDITWPFAWYQRDAITVAYVENALIEAKENIGSLDFVLLKTPFRNKVPRLSLPFNFVGCYRLRSWWDPDQADYLPFRFDNIKRSIHWFLYRQGVGNEGSVHFCMYDKIENP